MRRGERVILEGIPLPSLAYIEVAGAERASFRIADRPPKHLQPDGVPKMTPQSSLVVFVRTGEVRHGFPVFVPDGKST